jgi:hypothetical protein
MADTLLSEGRSFWSSSDNYTQLEASVRGALEAIVRTPPVPPRPTPAEERLIELTGQVLVQTNLSRLLHEEQIALLADIADEAGTGNDIAQRALDRYNARAKP